MFGTPPMSVHRVAVAETMVVKKNVGDTPNRIWIVVTVNNTVSCKHRFTSTYLNLPIRHYLEKKTTTTTTTKKQNQKRGKLKIRKKETWQENIQTEERQTKGGQAT